MAVWGGTQPSPRPRSTIDPDHPTLTNSFVLLSTKNASALREHSKPSQGPQAARREKHTVGSFPREHRWNHRSNQLLFLNLERERAPEGQGGAGGGAGQPSCCCRAAQRVTRDAGGVTAALERNPPHRTLCFLLVCAP